MSKFDNLVNSFISEDGSLDQWNSQKMKEEEKFQSHEYGTISHPLKDQMIEKFLPMVRDSKMEKSFYSWIKEAEHQDGETFWDNFETPKEAIEDFMRSLDFYM